LDPFLRKLGIELPIILAPMAGVSTPEMAAAVSNASGLGSIGVGSVDADVACPESSADAGYRAALSGPMTEHTVMTAAISGRPARCLANRFTALGEGAPREAIPSYPIAYDAGKALHAAAKAAGEFGYGAQWAGQGAPLARPMPAAELVACLRSEMAKALRNR
jgi:nitronate monooxygenase